MEDVFADLIEHLLNSGHVYYSLSTNTPSLNTHSILTNTHLHYPLPSSLSPQVHGGPWSSMGLTLTLTLT